MTKARIRRVGAGVAIGFALLSTLPAATTLASTAPAHSAADPAGDVPNKTSSWIVTLEAGADPNIADALALKAGGKVEKVYRHALRGFAFQGSAKAADALRRNPKVRSVVRDGVLHATADTIGTGVSRIQANHATPPSAYASGFAGDGVRVAILDTGIDLTHPDLVPNLDVGLGKNCMTSGPPQDGHGHGTHVAGIVAAADNGLGVVGVAPHARLVPFKVLDDTGTGEWSNLICAVDIITGYATDNDPSNDIQVANMSLGDVGSIGTCTDGGIREAICNSVAAGVTYVAAAGNSTVDASTFIPAAFPEVISVSAITDLDGEPGGLGGCWLIFLFCDDTLAEYSNYGATIDVAAPGTQIYSDWTGGTYMTEMGTSMASPHVAGVAALLKAAYPSLTPADVQDMLKTTGQCPNGQLADADGTGTCAGKGQWGNDPDGIAEPLVNALNAVAGGTPGDRRPTVHITSPAGGATVSGSVSVTATATDDVGVARVEFLVNGRLVATDTNGADGWSTTWDAGAVDGGFYTLSARAFDTANQVATNAVTVKTAANAQGSWVGTFGHDGYVLANWNGDGTDVAALPAGVTYSLVQGSRYLWASPTTDVRALQAPDLTDRRALTWYDTSSVRLRLTFANAYTGTLHLYAVDWDAYGGNRYENVVVDDGHGAQTVELSTSFFNGGWVHAPISVAAGGSVDIRADYVGGETAVLSGLFLGGPGPTPPPPPPPPPPLPVDQPGVQGTWVPNYGRDGYVLANWDGTNSSDLANLPLGSSLTVETGGRATWAATTTDVRGLQSPGAAERRAETWYDATSLRVRLTLGKAYSGTLHLYAVDWDAYGGNRYEKITIDDGSGPRIANLSSSFVQGAWIHVPIAVAAGGSVVITVDKTAGNSAVLAGLFLGGAPPAPSLAVDQPGVQGTWVGTYGHDGSVLANWDGTNTDLTSLPPGASLTLERGGRATWAASTTDVRALTNPAGTARQMRTWYEQTSIRLRLAFANPFNGTLHLYAVDWDAYQGNRYERITVDDGSGPRVAALTTSFVQGAWIHAPISVPAGGSVVINVDRSAGYSAVLAGLFLDAGPVGPTVPGAPSGLTATRGNQQVALSWTAPSSDGGSSITGYTVTASPGGATCASTTLGCTVTGLTNGTAYSFTVTATNGIGTGPASAPVSATPATVPGAPTGLTATPGNGQVALAWTAPGSNGGSPITGYTVTASPGGATCTSATTGCTVLGLTNGTPYSFTVVAANAIGPGPASAPASATPVASATVPGAPTGLTATRGNGQVTLAWSAPSSNGGSTITGYAVTGSPAGSCAVNGSTLGCTITGLTNGTAYTFTVTATNAVGTGPASAPASAIPATVPGAPTGLTATPGDGQVTLAWTAPASNGGSSITGYAVAGSPGGSCSVNGSTTGCTITGLSNGTAYSFTVTATNAVGTGAASSPASATPVAAGTPPGAPTGLGATAGNAQVVLAWTAPSSNGGSAITGYRIYRSTTAGAETLLTTAGNVTTFTNTGLTNGTPYYYQVTAVNAVGESVRSAEVSAVPATVPGAPRNVSAKSASPNGVTITWQAPTSNGGSSITGYRIYRSTSPGTETFLVPVGNVTSYTDTSTTSGTRYWYQVAAVNGAGTGALSSQSNARAS